MKMTHKYLLRLTALFVVLSLVIPLSACGKPDDETNSAPAINTPGTDNIAQNPVPTTSPTTPAHTNSEFNNVQPLELTPLFQNGLLAVSVGGKWGYIDENGVYVINPQFDSVSNFSESGLAIAYDEDADAFGYIDKAGDIVIDCQFEAATDFSNNGLAAVKIDDTWGYIDKQGAVAIKSQFDYAYSFSDNGLARVSIGGVSGYIDKNGKYVINPQFDSAGDFAPNGLARVKSGGLWGYIDKTGNFVIEPQFTYAGDFGNSEFVYAECDDDDWTPKKGYIDTTGKWVLDVPDYLFPESSLLSNGIALARFDGYGIIDATGNYTGFISPDNFLNNYHFVYDSGLFAKPSTAVVDIQGTAFVCGLAPACDEGQNGEWLCGYVDKSGAWIIPPQFEYAFSFSDNGLAAVYSEGLYGFINTAGEWAIEPQFGAVLPFAANGLAAVMDPIDELWGYIDETGVWEIEPRYKECYSFSVNGFAPACDPDTGLYGYIDNKGEWVIEPSFAGCLPFSENRLAPANDGETHLWGAINESGAWVIEPQFISMNTFAQNGLSLAAVQNKYGMPLGGFIDGTGEWVIEPSFTAIKTGFSDNGLAPACTSDGELWGYINETGEWEIPPMFDFVTTFSDEGLAFVKGYEMYCFIDKTGKISQPYFADTYGLPADLASMIGISLIPAEQDGKYGYVDETKSWVIEPLFDDATYFSGDGYAVVRVDGRYGIIDTSGEYIARPQFSDVRENIDVE